MRLPKALPVFLWTICAYVCTRSELGAVYTCPKEACDIESLLLWRSAWFAVLMVLQLSLFILWYSYRRWRR